MHSQAAAHDVALQPWRCIQNLHRTPDLVIHPAPLSTSPPPPCSIHTPCEDVQQIAFGHQNEYCLMTLCCAESLRQTEYVLILVPVPTCMHMPMM